jgi:hopanoid-associated phosphorylase
VRSDRFLGVVCGLKSEASIVREAVRDERVRVAASGADAARAELLAHEFAAAGAAAIVSVGVSGALRPDLSPGDLLVADAVKSDLEEFTVSDLLLSGLELEKPAISLRRAVLFGSDEIVATILAKARLASQHGADAVDMESHGAARAARATGLPFAAIRAIADPASRALPKAALNAVAADGSTRTLAVLFECAKAPGDFPALLQLGADSAAALRTLRVHLGPLFRRLFLSLNL